MYPLLANSGCRICVPYSRRLTGWRLARTAAGVARGAVLSCTDGDCLGFSKTAVVSRRDSAAWVASFSLQRHSRGGRDDACRHYSFKLSGRHRQATDHQAGSSEGTRCGWRHLAGGENRLLPSCAPHGGLRWHMTTLPKNCCANQAFLALLFVFPCDAAAAFQRRTATGACWFSCCLLRAFLLPSSLLPPSILCLRLLLPHHQYGQARRSSRA